MTLYRYPLYIAIIVDGDQAYHCCVICKLNDGVGVMLGHAVVGEQGIPLRGPRVEDQCGRCVVAYPTLFGPRVLSLVMSFEGTMVLNAEL